MLGIYDISEAEKEFVISRKFGEELTENAFYRKLEKTNGEVAERFKESVAEAARLLEPSDIFVISDIEATKQRLVSALVKEGILLPMNKDYPNSYLYRSDPNDVARSEKDTYICTSGSKDDVGPTNNWIHTDEAKSKLFQLLRSSLKGKTMYVIPYWLGPKGSKYGQAGIQVTDSRYVVVSLLLMVRCGEGAAEDIARSGGFVFGIHSTKNLDPKNKYVCHFPEENDGNGLIISVNSNYGGNALLSKKCHALRIASNRARREGWLAEHMMMIGVRSPDGKEVFISAAFPSASGKTNLSMLEPPETLKNKGWSTSLISDDIIWLFNREGMLNAINPEAGMFGVAPHTNYETNPNAMKTISHDTIFTNIAVDSEMRPYWDGLPMPKGELTDWTGKKYNGTGYAAHPNSRFTSSIRQYPYLSDRYDDPKGAPVSAFLYGGRRAKLVPLVYESFSWEHGVLLGAMQRVETTAAAEYKSGILMNDPMANRPFLSYNMGDYFQHHLDIGSKLSKPPKVFSVNWFRKDERGKFIWPGYSNNMYVVRWILDEVAGKSSQRVKTPIGYVPKPEYFEQFGFDQETMADILEVDSKGYLEELNALKPFFEMFGDRFPERLWKEYYDLKARLDDQVR